MWADVKANRANKPSSRRILHEAMTGVVQRSSLSAMTVLGIALGVASFIAVLGVTTSANAQIGDEFLRAEATQISVTPRGGDDTGSLFPRDADALIASIDGVAAVGRWWSVAGVDTSALPESVAPILLQPQVLAATPGYWTVVGAEMTAGRTFDDFLDTQPVAVLGQRIAAQFGITELSDESAIVLDGQRLAVIGIVANTVGSSAALTSVTIPAEYARTHLSSPGPRETMIITAERGGSTVVAEQVAAVLDPRSPDAFYVVPPPAPAVIRDKVNSSTQALFYALAAIGVVVSGVGIANAALIGVIARAREIALRRSLGALPRHIVAQFLLESSVRGLLGGLIGTAVAVIAVSIVGVAQRWTVVIEPWSLVVGPAMGIVVGTLAGLYPSLRATRVQPTEAFRR